MPTHEPFEPRSIDHLQVGTPRPDYRWLKRLTGLLAAIVGLLALFAITARAEPVAFMTPTPHPIVAAVCRPPSCVEATRMPGPIATRTTTPEPTLTPTAAPVAYRPPDWLDIACLTTIQRILQNELRGSANPLAYQFLATQLLYRAFEQNACVFPGWTRQATGTIPPIVSANLNVMLMDLPLYNWPRCMYIGNWHDLDTWIRAGYAKTMPVLHPGVDKYGPVGASVGMNCIPD